VDLLSWEVFTDWRVNTMTNQTRFSDVYSILDFNPRSWLNFESETLFDTDNGRFRLAYHTVTIMPSDTWHWTLGHYYLHDDPVLGVGNNLITSTFLYRFNENWSVQFNHNFEARDGHMQEQSYALFRDFRGWTAQLLVRWRDNRVGADDFTVFFACSLKAFPHMMNIAGGGL
jgi:hypothetical protein